LACSVPSPMNEIFVFAAILILIILVYIQKFPDRVDNEIYTYLWYCSLRSNTKGCGGKTHQTDSQNSDATAPSGRELYHLQFSVRAASTETFGYTFIYGYPTLWSKSDFWNAPYNVAPKLKYKSLVQDLPQSHNSHSASLEISCSYVTPNFVTVFSKPRLYTPS
jgi:hypothetical protein